MIKSAKGLLIVTINLVWKITDNLSNSPNYSSAIISCYTVLDDKIEFLILVHSDIRTFEKTCK